MDINDLVEVDGKMYRPSNDKLYSGIVYDSYTGTGEKKLEGFYRNGLKNGKWTWWNILGGIVSTGNFRKGLLYGQWKFYHSNGQLKAIGNYRNGDGTNRDEYGLTAHGRHGKWTFWHDNGIQASEITYKEGEIVGIWIFWNDQGQKEWEGTIEEYNAAVKEAAELAAKIAAEEARLAKEARLEEEARVAEKARKSEEARLAARPSVPIESEDEDLEDVTIEETDLESFEAWDAPPPPPEGPRVKFIPYDDPPRPLTPIRPKYPEIAQEAGIEGTVIVQVFVDKKGRVKETIILKGIPNTGLDEAAIAAIRKTRFEPAKQRKRPVGVWISIPVNFRLK